MILINFTVYRVHNGKISFVDVKRTQGQEMTYFGQSNASYTLYINRKLIQL